MTRRPAALLLAFLIALPGAAAAQNREPVRFPSADSTFSGELTGSFYRPAGNDPIPAMVLLHNCYGVQPFLEGYAAWFVSQGYAALVVDSFGPRRAKDCNALPYLPIRAMDAYGALAYLRRRADVDPRRIGLIGWSHGGGGAFLADSRRFTDDYSGGRPFRAVIGMYPVCVPEVQMIAAPLLVLAGRADDFQAPALCENAVRRLNSDAVAATMHVYPNVTHAFDNRTIEGTVRVDGAFHTIIYDRRATGDARERIHAFLVLNFKE